MAKKIMVLTQKPKRVMILKRKVSPVYVPRVGAPKLAKKVTKRKTA